MANQRLNLKEIHDNLMQRLDLERRAKRDVPIALEMEMVLSVLKNRKLDTRNSNNPVVQELQKQADIIIEQATALLNSNRKNSLSLSSIFRRRHKDVKTSFGGDDIFEEELAAVISAIEQEATGQTVDITKKLVGSDALGIEIEQISKRVIKAMSERHEFKTRIENTSDVKNITARSGKADVLGITTEYQGTLDPKWEELFRLFSNKTFSVKNYSSWGKDEINIALGATNYEKAIMGSLGALGYSPEDRERIFWQGLRSKRTSAVAEHFYHLQYGYELMGLGLGSRKSGEFQKAQQVDFFIYNDPSSNVIRVRSTAQMLLDALKNTKKASHLMKSITIAADKL